MSIALLRHWLGTTAPSPHDTELRRLVRDALIEHDVLTAENEAEGARLAREDRLRGLGFEEPTPEQRKENLALNVALREGFG